VHGAHERQVSRADRRSRRHDERRRDAGGGRVRGARHLSRDRRGPAPGQGPDVPAARRRILRGARRQDRARHQLLQSPGLDRTGQRLTMTGAIDIVRIAAPGLPRDLGEVARLRIEVFRDFPYLYDGDLGYEEEYLRTYVQSPRSVIVLARDGDRIVGASTAIPLADESEELQR